MSMDCIGCKYSVDDEYENICLNCRWYVGDMDLPDKRVVNDVID